MQIPDQLKYTKNHEWIRFEDDGTAYIGITDFAQDQLGEIVYVEVETVGDTLDKDEAFATVEAVKTTSDVYMPVAGEVLEFNPRLDENGDNEPTLINSDPYGDGWIVKIKVADPAQAEELLDAAAYKAMIE
ncbi:MAG TPA: glycine cleavage system protein GcvH [Phaeodactylibacter sp.]|nr:glycine cleavage system protein GcvH [Phaeodactylibacter sp.]